MVPRVQGKGAGRSRPGSERDFFPATVWDWNKIIAFTSWASSSLAAGRVECTREAFISFSFSLTGHESCMVDRKRG